ncbi:MAG TPA: FAD-dependent oxidoreductase [Euzebyales bacterium]
MGRARVIVIGAGSTGAATAHDLALRGLDVIVVERGEVASGTTGRNHCLLHSGGRYCVTDEEAGIECIDENLTLRRIMPDLLELNDGLFVATNEDDLAYRDTFLEACARSHIPARELTPARARRIEPFLTPDVLTAVQVPDGVFEPYRLCLAFLATAQASGAEVRTFTEVVDLASDNGVVSGVTVVDRLTGDVDTIRADLVVNAGGPWAERLASMAEVDVPVSPTPGVMVTVDRRLNNMVINRLNTPSDGDIVVPQRTTSIIGTTSWTVDDPDHIPIPGDHVTRMRERGRDLLPRIADARVRGVMAVARPLISKPGVDARLVSRTFECFDHEADGMDGFVTISGGKTTTARAMAEKVSDIVCGKLGLAAPCRTAEVPLTSYRRFHARTT